MSNNALPTLPGLDYAVTRETFYPATTIHTTIADTEYRTTWGSVPRYRYRLSWNVLRANVNAPAPWQAQTEVGVLLKFLADHAGQFDSFLFTDPYDQVQRRVRFESDSLTVKRLAEGVWACEATLVSVK